MASSTNAMGIIGRIPGYNMDIDPSGYFSKILLRDVTYIDLYPAIYTLNDDYFKSIQNLTSSTNTKIDLTTIYQYQSGNKASTPLQIFKSSINKIAEYVEIKWKEAAPRYSSEIMMAPGDNILDAGLEAIEEFRKQECLRILAANDSTFTETVSNNFGDTGILDDLSNKALGMMGSTVQSKAGVMQRIQKLSYNTALETLVNFSSSGSIFDVISGKVLGIQFSSPKAWQDSNYASTLSLFIKLASPSGSPADVLKYITLPILSMLSAGSPLTVNGVTYGMPLIWDVRAYGITRFKVGAIAAMTISRGSYETVFNYDKQPLLVDVRLNIIPLVQDFAVQFDKGSINNIFTDKLKTKTTSIITNLTSPDSTKKTSEPDFIATWFKALAGSLNQVITPIEDLVTKTEDIYNSSTINDSANFYTNEKLLGVQSPKNEVDGLLGLASDAGNNTKLFSPGIPEEIYRFSI